MREEGALETGDEDEGMKDRRRGRRGGGGRTWLEGGVVEELAKGLLRQCRAGGLGGGGEHEGCQDGEYERQVGTRWDHVFEASISEQ